MPTVLNSTREIRQATKIETEAGAKGPSAIKARSLCATTYTHMFTETRFR